MNGGGNKKTKNKTKLNKTKLKRYISMINLSREPGANLEFIYVTNFPRYCPSSQAVK